MQFASFGWQRQMGAGGGGGGFRPNFWVDSVNGDDGNDGLTQATAFQTLAAAETAALAYGNGVKIGLNGGSEWRDALALSSLTGVQVRGVNITNRLPVVRGDDVISGPWETSADRSDANTEVYSQSYSFESDAANQQWLAFWDMGRRLAPVASLALCQSTPGSWYMNLASVGITHVSPQDLYIHPFGSTNPNSDGKTYEGIKRIYGIRLGDNSQCHLVWARRAGHNNGAIFLGQGARLDSALSSDSVRHQALLESGVQNRVVGWSRAADARTGQIHLEFYRNVATGLRGTWQNCIAKSEYNDTFDAGFGLHSNGSTFYEKIIINDCLAVRCSVGGVNLSALEANRCAINNGKWNITVDAPSAPASIINDLQIIQTTPPESSGTIISALVLSSTEQIFDGLRIMINIDARTYWGLHGANTSGRIRLRNSVLVDATTNPLDWRRIVSFYSSSEPLELTGTILDASRATNGGGDETRVRSDQGAAIVGSGNVFWPSDADTLEIQFVGGSLYSSPGAYLAAVQPGNEVGSVVEDPEIVDPLNGDFSAITSNGAGLLRSVIYLKEPPSLSAAEAWVIEGLTISDTELAPAISAASATVTNAGGSVGAWDGETFSNSVAGSLDVYPRLRFTGRVTSALRYHVMVRFSDGAPVSSVHVGSASGPALTRWGNVFAGIATSSGSDIVVVGNGTVFSTDLLEWSIRRIDQDL